MIVYIAIGNSDDKLGQRAWSDFFARVNDLILLKCAQYNGPKVHGSWMSLPDAPYQNACWCVEFDGNEPEAASAVLLRSELAFTARAFGQESIAWTPAQATEFIIPEGGSRSEGC